ncbi:16508_t:CDS:2, partial [Gigaspora rosea]
YKVNDLEFGYPDMYVRFVTDGEQTPTHIPTTQPVEKKGQTDQ